METQPPSGQGVTMTLKGLCLVQLSLPNRRVALWASMSATVCLCWRLWSTKVRSELLQTLSTPKLDCLCEHTFLYLFYPTEEQQLHQQSSQNQNNWGFDSVCGAGETGNEIMLRAPTVCTKDLSESRAGHGGEYRSCIIQSGLWK